jgi:hypothetical protein
MAVIQIMFNIYLIINLEERLTIFLERGGFHDPYRLEKETNSPLNLHTINKKIEI